MDVFSQKLRIVYGKLFHEDIDKFTEAFIDYNKFIKNKSETQNRNQFFLNRKTVLRRWLNKDMRCTSDFQKSFKYYNIAQYYFQGNPLFTIDDFKEKSNLIEFDNKLNLYLQYEQRAYVNTDYKYIYAFCEEREEIYMYALSEWKKGQGEEINLTIEQDNNTFNGTFSLRENNNIFITIQVKEITLYMLFHDNNDSSCDYIVGTSMGYLAKDNKVPRAEKVLFSKEKLDTQDMQVQFILNETASISAIENRLNMNIDESKNNHFIKYSNTFKKYHKFFTRLIRKKFQQNFYHRLAFREFYAFHRLFEKVAMGETYFVMNYQRAFFELIQTVEVIQNIPLYMVVDCDENHFFIEDSEKSREIKNRFFNLSHYGIEINLILVFEDTENISLEFQKLLDEMKEKNIMPHLVQQESIINKVNSIDFFFIHLGDNRDFVLADPIRDNKDVFKLFINEVSMDEYRMDYRKILKNTI